jgi:hypothetical protein
MFDFLDRFKSIFNKNQLKEESSASKTNVPKLIIPDIPIVQNKELVYSPKDFNPIDRFQNYFNFVVQKPNMQPKQTRLGKFSFAGEPVRKKSAYPKELQYLYPAPLVGVLHVPVANIVDKKTGRDNTAELVARYLASSPVQASVHLSTDRDSFILSAPFDTVTWHCANAQTHQFSIGIEMGGLGEGKDEYKGVKGDAYWSTDDAIQKYRILARGVIEGLRLLYPKNWKEYMIPLQKAELKENGSFKKAGWTQHREVPIWSNKLNRFNQNHSAGKNQVLGQHTDICADFPWELFFTIFKEEVDKL